MIRPTGTRCWGNAADVALCESGRCVGRGNGADGATGCTEDGLNGAGRTGNAEAVVVGAGTETAIWGVGEGIATGPRGAATSITGLVGAAEGCISC